jgi:anti-sigma regulatory factor (Ser/Thr protein kinase)
VDARPGIVMEFASDPRHARVARAAITATAVLENFTLEQIDDVRLLVDEVFNALAASGASRITFALVVGPNRLAVTAHGTGSRAVDDHFPILRVLSDAYAPGWSLQATNGGVTYAATFTADRT